MSFKPFKIGDIITVKYTIFKDTKKIDIHINGRPAVVLHQTDNFFYYLTFTSKAPSDETEVYHYQLPETYKPRFKERSFVNLKNINIKEIGYHYTKRRVDNKTLKMLIEEFINYQESTCRDRLYTEISNYVKRYVAGKGVQK